MLFAARVLAVLSLVLTLATIAVAEYWMLQEMRGLPLGDFSDVLIVRPAIAFALAILGVVGSGLWERRSGVGPGLMLLAGIGLVIAGGLVATLSAAPLVIGAALAFFPDADRANRTTGQ